MAAAATDAAAKLDNNMCSPPLPLSPPPMHLAVMKPSPRRDAQRLELLSEPVLTGNSFIMAAAMSAASIAETKGSSPLPTGPKKQPWINAWGYQSMAGMIPPLVAEAPAPPPGPPPRGAGFHRSSPQQMGSPSPFRNATPQEPASPWSPLPKDASIMGTAAVGVVAANGAKAEYCWSRLEKQMEAIQNDTSPEAAAKLTQARAVLHQKARALEAQLRTASGALRGEEARALRLSEQLQKAKEDPSSARLHKEFSALDRHLRELEGKWLLTREDEAGVGPDQMRAAEMRSKNQVLRQELEDLRVIDPEIIQLEAEIAKADQEQKALKDEMRRLRC